MRRYLIAAGIVLGLFVILAGVKFKQISKLIGFGKAAEVAGPPPEAVGTAVASTDTWQGELAAVGSVAPARGVTISNEIPGVVKAIRFESGAVVKAGQVLVELDASVEAAQLASAQARLQLATTTGARTKRLLEGGAATQVQLESDEAQQRTALADVTALRAQIEKKTVRAPFAGRLGIRSINLGQYLNPGTPITVLESLGSVYVDFSLPQQFLGQAVVGTPVNVAIASAKGEALQGKVAAVDPTIDAGTRTIKLRATVQNAAERLRPGMFVNVAVVLPKQDPVVTVPAMSVVHAPYGDSVYVVEPKKDESGAVVKGPDGQPAKVARQQFVRLGPSRGDFVAIAEGLKNGEEVVTQGAFKLRNGAPVAVNNSVKLTPSLDPHPINR
ncbi:MAG: efflux RND transporter periplasmic adaptor subunit [Deltaproteobacteria bacterium]|nr:efflux RND transporter periplasmic adaptor subunit [Deltaproteobacteria bacterium]